MSKRLIIFDEETANLLDNSPNASETVRQAVKAYHQHISPDGKKNLVQAMTDIDKLQRELNKSLKEFDERLIYLTELLERLNTKIPDVF